MIATGIIAEFNPFTKGHAYILEQARMITNADAIIVVMSGNFVQRGEPAIIEKYTRAQMALQNGADLVVELPVVSALGSAFFFAKGGIDLLSALKCSHLVFGSENNNIAELQNIVEFMTTHQEEMDHLIKDMVSQGCSYPLARHQAILQCGGQFDDSLLTKPNNLLGLEYLQQLQLHNSGIQPHTVKRLGQDYHDCMIALDNTTPLENVSAVGEFYSASALRQKIFQGTFIGKQLFPANCENTLGNYMQQYAALNIDDFTDIIFYKLYELKKLSSNQDHKCTIQDLSQTLLNKLWNQLPNVTTATQLIEAVKSKDLTYTRISRALCHLILDFCEDDYIQLKEKSASYIRVLGFNDAGQQYLSSIKKELSCPIVVKPADYKDLIAKDIEASELYHQVLRRKSGQCFPSDYTYPLKKHLQ